MEVPIPSENQGCLFTENSYENKELTYITQIHNSAKQTLLFPKWGGKQQKVKQQSTARGDGIRERTTCLRSKQIKHQKAKTKCVAPCRTSYAQDGISELQSAPPPTLLTKVHIASLRDDIHASFSWHTYHGPDISTILHSLLPFRY